MYRRDFVKLTVATLGTVLFTSSAQSRNEDIGWLTGFKEQHGRFGVAKIDKKFSVSPLFRTSTRLHGIVKHPTRNEILAAARRPGTALYVFDLDNMSIETIEAEEGRHYYGHGAFSPDGKRFFAPENAYDEEKGVIGVYDAQNKYKRLGEWHSGGVGPHEIIYHDNKLFIANGGILTHPESGRAKLNLDSMVSNVTVLEEPTGTIRSQYSLDDGLRHLSLRHMAITKNQTLVVGAQDQTSGRVDAPLVWTVNVDGSKPEPLPEPENGWRIFHGYVGSISTNGNLVCASSPRGNCLNIWNGSAQQISSQTDVCGVAASMNNGFIATTGQGLITNLTDVVAHPSMSFDNHCSILS